MADVTVGVIGTVRVVVTTVDNVAGTCQVRVLDNNSLPISPAAALPQGVVTVTELAVAVGDLLEEVSTGNTAAVRWVDPANPLRWARNVTGTEARSTAGWRKVGTFALS